MPDYYLILSRVDEIKTQLRQRTDPVLQSIDAAKNQLLDDLDDHTHSLRRLNVVWHNNRDDYDVCANLIAASRNLAITYKKVSPLCENIGELINAMNAALNEIGRTFGCDPNDHQMWSEDANKHTDTLRSIVHDLAILQSALYGYSRNIGSSMIHIAQMIRGDEEFSNSLQQALSNRGHLVQWCNHWLAKHGHEYDDADSPLTTALNSLPADAAPDVVVVPDSWEDDEEEEERTFSPSSSP